MNLYDFIKYEVFKNKRPQEFKIGQVWVRNTANPFETYTITIVDVKNGYVQYVYGEGTTCRYSDSADNIRYLFNLVP